MATQNTATAYTPFKARWVQGSPFDIQTTTHDSKPEPDENKHHWYMGFAIPKGPEWDAVWATMNNAASQDARCGAALCGQAGFGWKIEDCDNPNNPQNLGKASYPAGHWLIKFTRYRVMGAPPVVDGAFNPIINKAAVKRGDYFYVDASTLFNGKSTVAMNAGMYQNLNGLMFAESGEEIVGEGGFNAASAFAGLQGGAVVNGGVSQAGAPQAARPPQATTPPVVQQAPVTPPPVVQPANDLVQPGGAGLPPAPPAPAPVQGYLVNGVSYAEAALLGAGYTPEMLATLPRG